MSSAVLAALTAVVIWWVSTGVILVLDGLPRRTFPRSMSVATGLLGLALFGVAHVSNDPAPVAAYVGFGCAIVIWGWLEMSFLMGYLTGPRRRGCHSGCAGWRHWVHAVAAILYHELAIIALTATAFALSWTGGNQLAAQALLLLWGLRASAKLNLFLGVRNLSIELLPESLSYLGSYFRKRPLNFLFPVSVTAGSVLTAFLVRKLLLPGISDFDLTGYSLLATLAALGVLEHWMLVLPIPNLWGPSARGSLQPCSRRSRA